MRRHQRHLRTVRPGHGFPLRCAAVAGLVVATAAMSAACWAQQPEAPRVVVDFENPDAVKLTPVQAEAELVEADGGRALRISTEADAPWPGVLIEPRQGKWDLAGYDEVRMDVANPQDVPVRVLLSLNNPGADGRRHCSTESVSVPPRGRATLVVPFGSWHGSLDHPIDASNIVSVMVLLDRAGRSHRFTVDNIRAARFDRSQMEPVFADSFFKELRPAFGRGVNLSALEAPKEGDWGVVLKEEYFELIKSAGFDSVRIPVRWSAHAEASPPCRIDPEFLARIDWAVEQALSRRLEVVLNMHHYEEIFSKPDEHRERFTAIWRQIAEHYKDRPPALALELLNEPHDKLTAEKWNRTATETIAAIRAANPTRRIVVGPVGWNAIGELDTLVLPEQDRNLVVTVHYYSPFQFTHQGAGWVGGEASKWIGTKWTGTRAEKWAVARDLDKAIAWAVKHRRPIYLGEFGAYSKGDLESRARWTRFVADEAIARKMGLGYWEFCSGFGVYDPERRQWIEPLKEALLPSGRER